MEKWNKRIRLKLKHKTHDIQYAKAAAAADPLLCQSLSLAHGSCNACEQNSSGLLMRLSQCQFFYLQIQNR